MIIIQIDNTMIILNRRRTRSGAKLDRRSGSRLRSSVSAFWGTRWGDHYKLFYSTLKDFWGTQYARALSLILILMDDGDNACNKDKDAFYYVLILKDCEEYSNCDFEIICSIFINTSHYPEPWRSAQQQAYIHQVIIIVHSKHVVYMRFTCDIHTMTVSIFIIISSSSNL